MSGSATTRVLKGGPTRQTRLRARKAIEMLKEGDHERLSCSREYDNCFENGDGDWVAFLVMDEAHKNPDFARVLNTWPASNFVSKDWERHYQSMLTRMESGSLFE